MNTLRAIGRFWYNFMVGDEWRIAAGVIVSLSLIFALVHHVGMDPWLLLLLMILLTMALVIRRAVRHTQHNEAHRIYILSLVGDWMRLWTPLVLIAVIPVLSSYLKNTLEVSVQDLVLPIVLSTLAATLVAAVFFRGYLKQRFTFYLAGIFLVILISNNYSSSSQWFRTIVDAVLPFQIPDHLIGLIYLLLLGYSLYRLARWINTQAVRRNWRTNEVMIALTIAISTTFALQFIPAAFDIASAWPQYFYQPPKLAAARPTAAQLADKPDIYYIDMEDYASQQTLQTQMNFDNSGFLQFLANDGFYSAPNANSNYPYTVNSVASTLNANYLSDAVNRFGTAATQTFVPYFNTARNSPVIQQLKSLGYTYDLLGDWYETSNFSPLADHTYNGTDEIVAFNHTYGLGDFTDSEVQGSLFWSLIHDGITLGHFHLLGYNTRSDTDLDQSQLSNLRTLASQPAGGRFIFAQILLPHNYYYYNADGSLNTNPEPDNVGEPVKQKDTNEIQYVNSQIEPIISEIQANSHGKAVIVLQSDEGPQPGVMNHGNFNGDVLGQSSSVGDMAAWSQADLQMKFGIEAAYDVPEASAADLATDANPINIFRLVLNTYFNNQLPYLPVCNYAYPQGTNESFVYRSVNATVSGQANASCPQNGNFIKPGATKLVKSKVKSTNSASADDD